MLNNTPKNIEVKVGDIVQKEEWSGPPCYVRIDALHDDIKNGRPGFDGEIVRQVAMQSGRDPIRWKSAGPMSGKWGYMDQIIRVVHSA